jgi:hypothetical protein
MPQKFLPAVLLDDGSVYKRTTLGQRELLRQFNDGSDPAMRILARVNGYTALRQLVEQAPSDARGLIQVLPDLMARGLIELLNPPSDEPR